MERDLDRSSNRKLSAFFTRLRSQLSNSQIVAKSISAHDSSALNRGCAGKLFAESKADVLQIVKAANRFGVAIDPISTGLNVGYGDYYPEKSNQVVVDLRRMNRILEFNRSEGWIRIEPGVSQGEVAKYLTQNAPEYQFDLTYWLKESSVIGNSLERGRTLVTERENDLIGAELVLGSGETLRTGFDPHGLSPLSHGLNLHPLIFQSNLGIVVEGTIKLHCANKNARYHLIGFERLSELTQTLEKLASTSGVRPLRWFCSKTFESTPVPSSIRTRFKDLKGGVLVVESNSQGLLKDFAEIQAPIRRDALMVSPSLDIVPREPISFYSFSIRPSEIRQAQRKISSWMRRFPFRFFQTISFLELAPVVLLRAHADPAQYSVHVRQGFRELSFEVEASGYVPFRDHSGLPTKNWTDTKLKKMIKIAFDPKGIISPGRYSV